MEAIITSFNEISKDLVDAATDLTADDKANLFSWVSAIGQAIDEQVAAGDTASYLLEQKAEIAAMLAKMSDIGIK